MGRSSIMQHQKEKPKSKSDSKLVLFPKNHCASSNSVCHLGFCLNGNYLLLQNPPEKQPRPKSLQLGDRRLTLSLFQGATSQLNLSNPLSPLPASPQPEHTPRSSSMSLLMFTVFYYFSNTYIAVCDVNVPDK